MDLRVEGPLSTQPSQADPTFTSPCSHHGGCNFLWVVPIQVELEGHHLVVVGLQLALHHSVTLVRDLWGAGLAQPRRTRLAPAWHSLAAVALTLVMRSLERARRRSSFPEARLGGSLVLCSLAESPS